MTTLLLPYRPTVLLNPTPDIGGRDVNPNATLAIFDNGQFVSTVQADASGVWSYTFTTPLIGGGHTLVAREIDPVTGNQTTVRGTWSVLEDHSAPGVGVSTNNKNLLAGQSEAGARVTVIDAAGQKHMTVADQDGHWQFASNPLTAGEQAKIFATDPAGNQGAKLSFLGASLLPYDMNRPTVHVNTTLAGNQDNPSVTRLADGKIVVVWQGVRPGSSGTEVFLQLYQADGVTRIGGEQQVNQSTLHNQDSPQVTALADGGFVVVWESTVVCDDDVFARRYDSLGSATTGEFRVNDTTSGNQNSPAVTALSTGGYAITWLDLKSGAVKQRLYDANDQPLGGESTVSAAKGLGGTGGPEVAEFTDAAHEGMYVVVWSSTSGVNDRSSSGVTGQLYRADGTALGSAFQVNTTTDHAQSYPDVVTLADGSFLVVWDSNDAGANGSDVRAVHYTFDSATGAVHLVGSGDFIVNTYTPGKQYKPVPVALDDGGYLVVYGSQGGDGSGSAIFAQRYDAQDHKVGHEFLVNTTTDGDQGYICDTSDMDHILDAVLMADGKVFVTWQSNRVDGISGGLGVEAVVLDVNAAYYSEFTVNSVTAGKQTDSAVASLPDGGSVVVWVSANGDGSGTGIKAQLLDSQGMPVGGEFLVNATTKGNQQDPQVTALANGDFVVVWDSPASGAANYIKGQLFGYGYDGSGNVVGVQAKGAEFNVSAGSGSTYQGEPDITSLADGGYLVVWQAMQKVGGVTQWVVYGRQYDAGGVPVTGELQLAATNLRSACVDGPLPSVTQLADGEVVVSYTAQGTGDDVRALIYNPQTHTVGQVLAVNQTAAGTQDASDVTALANGNFIVTWESNDHSGPDKAGYGVWGRLYAANGAALGNEFLINTTTASNQEQPRVVSRDDGSFAVVYLSQTDPAPGAGTFGVYAQFFDAAGHRVGGEIQVNQLVYGAQTEVDASFLAGGQLFVTWTDAGVGDGSGTAIKGRLIDLDSTVGLPPGGSSSTLIDYTPPTPVALLQGTDGDDVLDAHNVLTVNAGNGNDSIFIGNTHFEHIDGGTGDDDWLVWDSFNDLNIGAVSSRITGIEAIQLANGASQTLTIRPQDVLNITDAEHPLDHSLRITGDTVSPQDVARDTVNIDLSLWTTAGQQQLQGLNYDAYVSRVDPSIQLLIQQGMAVV